MSGLKILLVCLLLVTFGACSREKVDEAQNQPPTSPSETAAESTAPVPAVPEAYQSAPASNEQVTRGAAPARAQTTRKQQTSPQSEAKPETLPQSEIVPVPAAQAVPAAESPTRRPVVAEPVFVTLPTGTQLDIRLVEPLDTGINNTGDIFQATLDSDLEAGGRILVPRGSIIKGKLVLVEQSGRVQGRAKMSLTLIELGLGEVTYPITTNTLSFEAEATTKKDALKVGAGAGIGALIGAIAGGGKGAAIGAAVGGGAGTATVVATKGKELQFAAEHEFSFSLSSDLRIQAR